MKRYTRILILALAMLLAASPALAGCAFYDENGYHNFDQIDFAYASCETDGYYVIECQNCGITEKEITEKAYGHDWKKTSEKAATCEEKGSASYECLICGETRKETKKAIGHKWKDLYTIKEATCSSPGEVASMCTLCGRQSTGSTPKADHSYGEWIEQYPENGIGMASRVRSCKYCGESKSEQYYPEGTLYRGASNDKGAVKEMQQMLRDLGFLFDKADGIFGKNTENAVKAYQEHALFEADGIAWPGIISALAVEWEIAMYGPEVTPEPTAEPAPVLTPEPTAEPVAEIEIIEAEAVESAPYCSWEYTQDGALKVSHCEAHAKIAEEIRGIPGYPDESYALMEARALWQAEVNALYLRWQGSASDEELALACGSQATFAAFMDVQEKIWNEQFGSGSAEGMLALLLEQQCANLCELLYAAGK